MQYVYLIWGPLIAQQIPAGRRLERDIHPAICASELNQAATAGSVGMNVPIQMPAPEDFPVRS